MNVLFICQDHYPYEGACSSLLRKMFCAGLNGQKVNISILTVKSTFHEAAVELIDGITIYRYVDWNMISLSQIKKEVASKPFLASNAILFKIVDKFWKRVTNMRCFPDPLIAALEYKALCALDQKIFDVVIPVAGHYEAVKAAERYVQKRKCKLIIYQVDPCSTNYSYSVSSQKKRTQFESEMYNCADAVITTPIIQQEISKKLINKIKDKVIPMEFPNVSPQHVTESKVANAHQYGQVFCLFAGTIYESARDPSFTFKLFSALPKGLAVLHLVGVDKEKAVQFVSAGMLGDHIICHGTLAFDEVEKYIMKAQVLVNIGNKMTNQVPSKLFEYISTGKPIINICTGSNCPTIKYLNKYPYALNVFQDDNEIDSQVKTIVDFIKKNAGKQLSASEICDRFPECTSKFGAHTFYNTLVKVCDI